MLLERASSPISLDRSDEITPPSARRNLLIGFWAGLPRVNGLSWPFPEESSTLPGLLGLLLRASSMNGSTKISGRGSDSEGSDSDLGLGIGAGGTESSNGGLFSRTLGGSLVAGGINPPLGNWGERVSIPFDPLSDLLIASSVCGTSGGAGGASLSLDTPSPFLDVGTEDLVAGGGINLGATDPFVDSDESLLCSRVAATSGGTDSLPAFDCWVAAGIVGWL